MVGKYKHYMIIIQRKSFPAEGEIFTLFLCYLSVFV